MTFLDSIILGVLLLLAEIFPSSGYDFLSYGKKAWHQPPTSQCVGVENCAQYAADKAVDRKSDTCMRTDYIGKTVPSKEVLWYVDLGDIYSVYDVTIQYKDYGPEYENRQKGRFAGFSLYLSNTIKKKDGHLCYKDGPQLPPLNFTTACSGHGSHVIFYNERLDGVVYPNGYETSILITELCEVVVTGCKSGTYGKLCNMNCPEHCQENRCDIIDGTCLQCMPGWIGKFCQTACTGGSYGQDCRLRCSGNCRDGVTCNSVTGICDKGCASGWTHPMCNELCSNGRYGANCAFNCSGHCLNGNPCNRTTGHCDSGCNPGHIGELCNEVCTVGMFGEGCKQRCSGHCTNEAYCNNVNGACPDGCKNGYTGQLCNKSCALGYFGENCSNICSERCSEICRYTDGSCLCKAGWMGSPNCSTQCLQERYGENCIHSCSPNCANATCDRFNGSCLKGCKDPYYGEMCNQRESYFRLNDKSMSSEPLIIGGIFGACTFVTILVVLAVLLMRRGILRTWIERGRHVQTYVTSTDMFASPKHDSHTYKGLDNCKDEGNYINIESPKDDANTYQELQIPKDKENYVNLKLGAM